MVGVRMRLNGRTSTQCSEGELGLGLGLENRPGCLLEMRVSRTTEGLDSSVHCPSSLVRLRNTYLFKNVVIENIKKEKLIT